MRRYRVQEFLSIWEDFKSKHKNKKIWWAFSESKMSQYISSLIYGFGKKIFYKPTPAKQPFPQWCHLWGCFGQEDDWKKYMNYKYCSFHCLHEKLIFFFSPPDFEIWYLVFLFCFFLKHLYWSIIVLQWCVSFCFITKWISYTYTHVPIPLPSCISLPPTLPIPPL